MASKYAVSVGVSFVIMILSNYLANIKAFGGKDNKELSDTHPAYVSPDGATFAIWGIIYSFELLLVVVLAIGWSPDPKFSSETIFATQCPLTGLDLGQRIVLAFLTNAVWLPLFNNEMFFLALGVMAIYLAFLMSINLDLNAATVGSPKSRFVFGTGISMNASWILVAFCVSIFFCGGEVGWKDEYGVAGSVAAGIIAVIGVCCIGCLRAVFECEMAWAFVTAWALQGIHRMQTVENVVRFPIAAMSPGIGSLATWASGAVVLCMVLGVLKAFTTPPGESKREFASNEVNAGVELDRPLDGQSFDAA